MSDKTLIAKIMATTGIDRTGAVQAMVEGRQLAASLIERSSIGAGLTNIRENGIDAELADLAEERAAPPAKKRPKGTSPTARTLAECRKRGWIAQVVERYNPHAKVRVDLFGVIDLVAIVIEIDAAVSYPLDGLPALRGGVILGIQACAGASHADRRDKILAEPRARLWVEAGGWLELWSWSKRGGRGARKLWTLRVEVFTAESAWSGGG